MEWAITLGPRLRFGLTAAQSLPYLTGYPHSCILFGCVGTYPPNTSSITIDMATVSTTITGKKRLPMRLLQRNPLIGERDAWHLHFVMSNAQTRGTIQYNHITGEYEAIQMEDGSKLSETTERWIQGIDRGSADKKYTYPNNTPTTKLIDQTPRSTHSRQPRQDKDSKNDTFERVTRYETPLHTPHQTTNSNLAKECEMETTNEADIVIHSSLREQVEQMIAERVRVAMEPLQQQLLAVTTAQATTAASTQLIQEQVTTLLTTNDNNKTQTDAQTQMITQMAANQTQLMAMMADLSQRLPRLPLQRLQPHKTEAPPKDDL